MSATVTNAPVFMVRSHLQHIPEFRLPRGFSLRWYEPGDEEAWVQIHLQAEPFLRITPALFTEQFGSDATRLGERQCYLVSPEGEEIGTATAWFDDNFEGRPHGRVHYVAIVPDFQGRALSKPLMTAVCKRLSELGHERAYLATSAGRVPAIRLYRKFGFLPLIRNDQDEKVWARVET
jgi:GNAT superfamily N-acetyltransferase